MQNFKEYARFYDLIYKDKPYEKEVDRVLKWANYPKTLLELGCGTGKHTEYFVKKVNHIIAIDKSKEMLSYTKLNKKVSHFCMDINPKNLNQFSKVDCATALFNVVGYVWLEDILPFLQIKSGGYFVFDCWDYDKVSVYPEETRVKKFKGGYRVTIPCKMENYNFTLDFIIVTDDNYSLVETHTLRIYTYSKIKELCDLYGYKVKKVMSIEGEWTDWYCLQKI